jgi:hypothetical protein
MHAAARPAVDEVEPPLPVDVVPPFDTELVLPPCPVPFVDPPFPVELVLPPLPLLGAPLTVVKPSPLSLLLQAPATSASSASIVNDWKAVRFMAVRPLE